MKNILIIILSNIFILSTFSCSNLIKPKLCITCKYFIKDYFVGNKFGKCSLLPKDKEKQYFLIDGSGVNNKKTDYYYCTTAIQFDNLCGEEVKIYEKKKNL